MTRPAVIIGLGGTGQWVTTYVKKELLEDNQGKLPANVKLLSFDTWPDSNTGGEEGVADVVSIGNTKLDLKIEFIPLFGDTYSKGEDVVQDRAPYIGKRISDMGEVFTWLDAPYLRQHVTRDLWNLAIGAGQIRQFGRLGFFNHATAIRSHLNRAFTEVANANVPAQKVQVIFIASFAGGTGAGMFLDMAVMARTLLAKFGEAGAILRGIFVLPGTFSAGVDQEGQKMQARAYAAWRELARFMNLGPDHGAHTIKYDDHTSVIVNAKPFDQVFLVDASRSQYAFTNTRPENGVFPSIATFIGTALDDASGEELGAAVNRIQTEYDNKLGFSSFGAYGIQLPITHVVNEYALQTGRDLLRRWLAPDVRVVDGKEVIDSLQPNQALEMAGKRGSQEVKPFMTQKEHKLNAVVNRAKTDVANPTRVFESLGAIPAIYNLYEAFTTGLYGGKVDEDAQGGFCAPGADQKVNTNSWLGRLLIPGDHEKTQVIGPDGRPQPVDPAMLNAEVSSTVRGAVPTSRDQGCDPTLDEAERIIAAVENQQNGYIVSHYGGQGGRGSFDTELDKLYAFNAARFKQILEVELLNLLNGTVEDIYRGFTGRLGFVEEFLKTLFDALEWYQVGHLKAVKTKRGTMQLETTAKGILDTARSEMVDNAGKKCVFFFNHPRAFNKQDDYMDAAQNYCEVLKDEKLLSTLELLAASMKESVNQAKSNVAKWKQMFLTSPNSLYSQIQADYAATKNDIDRQVKANQAQKLQLLRNYPAKYEDVLANPDVVQRIDEQMKCLRWGVTTEGPLEISCEMFTDGEYVPLLYENDTHEDNKKIIEHNKKLISQIGRLAWTKFGDKHTLIEEIGRPGSSNYQNPGVLGQELVDHSGPMLNLSVPAAGVKSALRRAYTTSDVPGFNPANYIGQLDARSVAIDPPLDPIIGYKMTNSHNKHKLTVIQWIDRLKETDFAIYQRLQESYRAQIRGGDSHETASRLHIFPAEGNAAFYEHHLPMWLGKPVRELSPRVVLLMTDVERVRWFFQCYALGMIVHGRYAHRPGRWWRLVIPAGPNVMPHDIEFYNSDNISMPDPFELINHFVTGLDVTTKQPIVWDSVRLAVHRAIVAAQPGGLRDLLDAQIAPGCGTPPVLTYPGANLVVDPPMCLVDHLKNRGEMYYNEYIMAHGAVEETNPGWRWIRNVDYKDLADVARMMYIETLLLENVVTVQQLPRSIYREIE